MRAVRSAAGVGDEFFHGLQILAELLDAFVPRGGIGRGLGFRPVIVGPFHFLVVGVSAEIEDVPLRDAQVLQQLPRGMRRAVGFDAAQFDWEIGDGVIETEMRTLHAQ